MRGIYLASFHAIHHGHDIVYQDKYEKRDLGGDMLEVDLTPFDYVIATPPCNFWSIANYRRYESDYSQKTCHLLPFVIAKLVKSKKPFIIENVRNQPLFLLYGIYDLCSFYGLNMFCVGRHTYWTNTTFNKPFVEQEEEHITELHGGLREGGLNVHNVVEEFILYMEGEWSFTKCFSSCEQLSLL